MSGYHSTFNHNNDDDYQYGLFRKQEVENATKYKNNKEGNGNNDGENVAEKLSYLTKPSPCHNLKRINLATLEPTASGQRTKINTVDTVDDFTGTLSKGKILNAAMVAHLHQLEVRNQKLEKEKTSLEHQLAHVLRRLRTDQVDDEDDNQQFNGGHHSLSNVNHQQESQGVLKVTTTSPVKKKSLNQTVSKPAPIALYDYPNDRKSLMESNSAFSLAEYSSLSDAYEDICLNKNPVDEINGSDLSEMFREKDKTLNDDTELLSSHSNCKQSSDVVYNNFNKNRNNSYEHLHKDHFSESKPLSIEVNKSEERRKSETESPLFSPDDLLIYRPDDYDNTSASQYSSSSISLSPELGIKHKTPLSHRHRFILSRNEKLSSSLSIVSYNSSTDSIVLKENKLDENGLRYAEKSIKHYSTSLPVSPIIPVSWMSKGSFLKSVEKYTKKYDRKIDKSINSSTTQSSIHPASQSSIVQESINGVNNLNVGVLETFEVSNLNVGSYTPQSPMMRPKSRNIVKGPPKVHISRKHMYHPNDSLHFSDTSSSMNPIDRNEDVLSKCSLYPTSVLFESFNGSRSIQSILPQVESSTRPKNQSRQIHSPLLSQPPYSVPANCFGRKQLVVAPQEGLPHTQIKIGSIRDFLNTKLGFSFNTDSQHLINTEKDILVLKYLSSFIKKFEVYTCVSGFAYLLQNIQPNISNLIPILQTPENSTCQEQSSSSNSEASLTRAIHISKLMIDVSKKIDPSSWLPLKPLSHELYNSDSNTPEIPKLIPSDQPYSIENIPDDSTLTLSENHAGILLKLNNHLKIWHHYWCILTLKGLFLHQCQPTAFNQVTPTNQPKKVILFSDVSRLCRPTNMSTSISQLGTLSLIRNEPSCVSSISSSSATTTITPNTTMGTRPNVSAPVSRKFAHHFDGVPKYRVERYFELVLHNNKVYRLRGINSQQTAKWISLIKDSLRINEADRILNEHSSQVIKEGWLKRVKRGSVSWFWCRLAGFYLIYSLSPNSTVPVGCKILKNAYIQLIGNRTTSSEPGISRRSSGHLKLSTDDYDTGQLLASSSDSDSLLISLTCSNTKEEHQKTIKIWTPDHEPVYLLCPTPHECEQWKDSMIRASLYSNSPVSTVNVKNLSTTKLIDKIRKIWKNLVNPVHLNSLYHSNISIRVPISKTTPNDQSTISLRLFDHLLFLCHPQVNLIENSNSPPIEIPLNTLIKCSQWLTLKHLIMKQIVSFCFKYPFLKDELYLQLIKQAIFAGLDIKQNSKDAYMLLLKNKTNVKRAFSLLLCTKNQESLDSSNITNQLKHCDNFKQNNRNSYFQIGNQYRQSLIEVSSLLMSSSSTAKLIIPQTNLNSNNNSKRPEYWWPAIAVWECLCLFLTFILPSDPVIGCLECLFNLYLDPVQRDPTGSIEKVDIVDKMKSESIQLKMKFFTEISGYAAFCQDTLKRTKQLGGREHYPSALEVFTLSIRNPYTHVYPFSLPVYLPFGSNYEVVNFHGGSNVHDLHIQIIEKLGLNEVTFKNVVLFALYLCLGQSITDSKKIYLNPTWKICDIISVYEQSTLENLHADQCGPIRIDQISVKLLFKVQTFSWRFIRNLEYEKSNVFLLNFIVHQLHSSIISNQYQIPIRGIDFIDLVAYLCRADYYDYTELQKRQEQITFSQLLENYFPVHWLPKDSTDPRSFIQIKLIILERWTQISKYPQSFKRNSDSNDRSNNGDNNGNQNDELKSNHEREINTATLYACLGYLKHLKTLFPSRFNCSAYIAYVDNLPSVKENQLIWIVPQEEKVNILINNGVLEPPNSDLIKSITAPESTGVYCLKSIPYKNIVAYGGQQNGLFFLVYTEIITSKIPLNPSTSKQSPDPDLILLSSSSHCRSNQLKRCTYHPSSSTSSSSLSFCKGHGNYSQRLPVHIKQSKLLLNTQQTISLKKLKFSLTNMHSVIDLTNVLTFLINAYHKPCTM